jgi:hypothetical protein
VWWLSLLSLLQLSQRTQRTYLKGSHSTHANTHTPTHKKLPFTLLFYPPSYLFVTPLQLFLCSLLSLPSISSLLLTHIIQEQFSVNFPCRSFVTRQIFFKRVLTPLSTSLCPQWKNRPSSNRKKRSQSSPLLSPKHLP